MNPSEKNRSERYASIAVGLMVGGFVAIALCIAAYTLVLSRHGLSDRSIDWGTFGDFIGGMAGTVIALITLIAIAFTLHLQARELEETRAELRKQASTMERQTTETTFFHLLTNRQNTLARFQLGDRIGREAMRTIATYIAQSHNNTPPADYNAETFPVIDSAINTYRTELDPVIGSTMQLLRFVTSIKPIDRALDYKGIALADFSLADQVLFLFVGCSSHGQRYRAFEVLRDVGVVGGLTHNAYAVALPQALIARYQVL
jgi:hypothetical protein